MFNFIQYILLDFVFSNKQPYINNNISIWNEWYKVYPDEKHELIDLRQPLLFDYAINSKYKYEKPFDEIVEEYKKILEKENWQFLQKGENSITYVKDVTVEYDVVVVDTEEDIDDEGTWQILKTENDRKRRNFKRCRFYGSF